MEITNDVKINTDNLISNSEIEIIYSGNLKNSKKIFINYGYKPNSFEYNQIPLNSNNTVKIRIEKPGYFYFYFTDNTGKKDNNNYKDYQLYIKNSNLILTENSSMNELSYRYFYKNNLMYKTYYTAQSIKNTSRPQEIIIPKPFNTNNKNNESSIIKGYILEPVKKVVNYNVTEALIPTEHISMVSNIYSKKTSNIFKSIIKLLVNIPKLLGKNYS